MGKPDICLGEWSLLPSPLEPPLAHGSAQYVQATVALAPAYCTIGPCTYSQCSTTGQLCLLGGTLVTWPLSITWRRDSDDDDDSTSHWSERGTLGGLARWSLTLDTLTTDHWPPLSARSPTSDWATAAAAAAAAAGAGGGSRSQRHTQLTRRRVNITTTLLASRSELSFSFKPYLQRCKMSHIITHPSTEILLSKQFFYFHDFWVRHVWWRQFIFYHRRYCRYVAADWQLHPLITCLH